jgi:hypothetical protein
MTAVLAEVVAFAGAARLMVGAGITVDSLLVGLSFWLMVVSCFGMLV